MHTLPSLGGGEHYYYCSPNARYHDGTRGISTIAYPIALTGPISSTNNYPGQAYRPTNLTILAIPDYHQLRIPDRSGLPRAQQI
jgi:hypothetical protein